MNSDVMPSRVQMETNLLKKLVEEVKETIATEVEMNETNKPSFGIVDLWLIQKTGRYGSTASKRRVL
jgi:hypothetical protein